MEPSSSPAHRTHRAPRRPGRRQVLAGSGATILGALAGHPGLSQVDPVRLRRAAVVIGVDRTDGLAPLSAAASAARKMELFLREEGFEVIAFIDDDQGAPVVAVNVFGAVKSFVDRNTLDQLVIYFSGHGFMMGMSEYWVLSGAPVNPSETIAVAECAVLAQFTGIPNVVFISDACRSHPTTLGLGQLQGGYKVFPSGSVFRDVKVDMFFATAPGHLAYEVSLDESAPNHKAVFTEAFLHAFRSPWPDMVFTLDNGVRVIPNRKLEDFLIAETRRRAQEADITLEQRAVANVTTQVDHVFIGRVVDAATGSDPGSSPERARAEEFSTPAALREIVRTMMTDDGILVPASSQTGRPSQTPTPAQAAAGRTYAAYRERQSADPVLETAGLTITGAGIARVTVPEGVAVAQPDDNRVPIPHLLIDLAGRPGVTAYVELDNGIGLPLAVLEGYAAHLSADNDGKGIVDIRYNPVRGSDRFSEYEAYSGLIADVRSAIAAAVAEGGFAFGGSGRDADGAEAFVERVRLLNRYDPTLGLYAVYAFSAASRPDQVRRVAEISEADIRVRLFDIALLDGGLRGARNGQGAIIPFCPALRQGWELLRAFEVVLPEPAQAARAFITDSFWTAFTPEGGSIMADAIRAGAPR